MKCKQDRRRERNRKRSRPSPEIPREKDLQEKYGMTLAEYDVLLKVQGGACAICGKEPKTRRLAVDHCHETGRIRGLLCFRCNYGLGYFNDLKMLRKAYQYLSR